MTIHTDFSKQRLFGIDFDVVTMRDAVDWVFRKVAIGRQSHSRFVVTPNVNLTLRHQNEARFRQTVHHADLTICDGQPLVRLSRWFRKPLPERVAGSDLVFQIFEAAVSEMPLKVFLLGAAPGVAEIACENIRKRWDGVQVVGTCSPDFGFEQDPQQNQQIVEQINDSEADVLIIGLGAPKQETWAFNHRFELNTAVALCVGGTIDFLAGEQTRAPVIIRRMGVEWIWRMATNPGRLAKRYFKDSLLLPGLILDELSHLCPAYEVDLGIGGASREAVVPEVIFAPTTAAEATAAEVTTGGSVKTTMLQTVTSQPSDTSVVDSQESWPPSTSSSSEGDESNGGILLFADYLRAQQKERDGQ